MTRVTRCDGCGKDIPHVPLVIEIQGGSVPDGYMSKTTFDACDRKCLFLALGNLFAEMDTE